MLPLLAQDPAQTFDVLLVELPVARRRALGIDQTLTLEETDLGNGDVGEFLTQQGQDVADGQIGAAAHSSTAAR